MIERHKPVDEEVFFVAEDTEESGTCPRTGRRHLKMSIKVVNINHILKL